MSGPSIKSPKTENKAHVQIMLLLALGMLFFVGIWAMDMGVTASMFKASGVTAVVSNLLFADISPSVLYHLGLAVVVSSFVVTSALVISYSSWRCERG